MDKAHKQSLKILAHHLKPVVLLGSKGLTPAVINETDIALQTHELVKIKINGAERESRVIIANSICQQLSAQLIQMIGSTVTLYRKKEDKNNLRTGEK